jgi:4'-phosphopantetheinyl transferase
MVQTIWYLPFSKMSESELRKGLFLTKEELERLENSKSPKSRCSFLAGRRLLRKILSTDLGIEQEQLVVELLERGKPILKNFPHIHFGISHSHDLAIFAYAKFPIGIDLELIRSAERYSEVQTRFLPRELHSTPGSDFDKQFFKAWTHYEAFIKLSGQGLFSDYPGKVPFKVFHTTITMPPETYQVCLSTWQADCPKSTLEILELTNT